MLTLEVEKTSALDYSNLNSSIKETFTAIDRFESQAVDEILMMRDQQVYAYAGYNNFEEYCQSELSAWGGYRRINQLLGAKKVIEAAGEFGEHIKNERQARTLVRLAKEPEKLKAAVELALSLNPEPSESDFAAAAKKVVPPVARKKPSIQEPMVLPNQEPLERRYPKEYSEAIAQIEEQHKRELERLEEELRIRLQVEANKRAEEQVIEQISSLHYLYKQQREENVQLQQRLDEMEGLRKLSIENQQLLSRIQDLEQAVQQHPGQQWGNTMTQQATKVLNKQVKQALEKTIDLRQLAQEPPKENATECLRLMGMALKNLSVAMNNTQALEAAALILGSEPTQQAIAIRTEQLQMLPVAISDIRAVLVKPGSTWQDYWAVAQEYEVIKQDYWAELTTEETDLIAALEIASQPPVIQVGSIVAYADPYYTLYNARGEVVEDLGEDEVLVAWDHWKNEGKKTSRYFRHELRFWQPQ
jgi:hypothetical protein